MQTTTKYLLITIILIAFFLRVFGLNWDQGHHLHPDERAIVLSVVNLKFPSSVTEFLSVESRWNPHFFAYGSLPFYLLRIAGNLVGAVNPTFAHYDGIQLVGRILSALFDTGTVLLLFLLARKLFSVKLGVLASFFYALSVLPIQLSHFYAVDTLLTFFILGTLYCLIRFYEKPTIPKALLIGVCFGAALATKISASVLLISVGLALCVDFLLLFLKQPHKPHVWFPHLPRFAKHLLTHIGIIGVTTLLTFAFFEPYAFLDKETFWQQTAEQSRMTKSAFTFPYTFQYVGKINHFYEVKNIFLWGLGPILASISFIGAWYFTSLAVKKERKDRWAREVIIAVFFWTYFFIVGGFAIGFMRYMLPLYPLLCLFAAVFVYKIHLSFTKRLPSKLLTICYVLCTVALATWPLSFVQIYTKPNPRATSTHYINNTFSIGDTLAVEHWDDSLPLSGQEKFHMITLPLYDSDTPEKWNAINQELQRIDYIIIASNRLYTPLSKLTYCQTLPVDRCYTKTAQYYKDLFSGTLGYKKIAEFTNYPTIPFTVITINDQSADESFTVYDHPKIMIFKKQ